MEVKKVIVDGKDIEYVSQIDIDEYEDNVNEFDNEDTLDLEELNLMKDAMLDKTVEFSINAQSGEQNS